MFLSIYNITKSYKNNLALNSFTITLCPGIYALLGPNGSGKSTLMNIITDNLKADSGEITTAICVDAAAPMLPGDLASTVLLWAMFNIVLMGGRGLFNGLRIRSESWLGQTAL